jgi:hypothetical protein
MTVIEKIKAKTSPKNRRDGRILTAISGACATILGSGIVSNPIAVTVITAIGGVTGIMAGKRALKTV